MGDIVALGFRDLSDVCKALFRLNPPESVQTLGITTEIRISNNRNKNWK